MVNFLIAAGSNEDALKEEAMKLPNVQAQIEGKQSVRLLLSKVELLTSL